MKRIASAMVFILMMMPVLNASTAETMEVNVNPDESIDVCVTFFNPQDGTIRKQRTVQMRRARAERVVAFYNANPSIVVDFELGSCN